MESPLLGFIKQHQVPLVKIYHQESSTKGEGILLITQTDNSVLVSYCPHHQIVVPYFKEQYAEKKEIVTSALSGGNLEVKDKWLVTLPPLSPAPTHDLLPMYFGLQGKQNIFFIAIPQEIRADNHVLHHYIMIADAPVLNRRDYHWTVEGTETGDVFFDFCSNATKNDLYFRTFRRNPKFTNIVISGKQWHGEKHIQRLTESGSPLLQKMTEFRKNETYGSPVVYMYSVYGRFAPDTLRYVNSLFEMVREFGEMENWDMIELGGGYGGLCRIISCYVSYQNYTLVEVPQVLELAKKWLQKHALTNIKFLHPAQFSESTDEQEEKQTYDLLISEYSLSEMDEDGINYYFRHLVCRSRNCYLAMNIWEEDKKTKFVERLRSTFMVVKELSAYPTTEWPNYILIGKGNKELT